MSAPRLTRVTVLLTHLQSQTSRGKGLVELDALAMMGGIRGSAILGPVRCTAPADRSALSRTLIALGRIGLQNGHVKPIDVNPVLLRGMAPPQPSTLSGSRSSSDEW